MPSEPAGPPDWTSQVLAHVATARPTLGAGRLVCIDGLAGAGKTTLAAKLSAATGAPVIHTDDLLEGWSGLPALGATIGDVLRPLTQGRPSSWRRWDWDGSAWAETRRQAPVPLLVLEGVGSGASAYDDLITTLVWIEADRDLRFARGLARDGEAMRGHWLRWMDDEVALHERECTRERADVVLRA